MILLAGAVLAAATLIVFFLTAQGGSPPSPITLAGVSAGDLTEASLSIQDPGPGASSKLSVEQAIAATSGQLGGGEKVRQALLARVVDRTQIPTFDRVVWVINLDPDSVAAPNLGGFEQSHDAFKTQYALMFLDPDTGQFLFAVIH